MAPKRGGFCGYFEVEKRIKKIEKREMTSLGRFYFAREKIKWKRKRQNTNTL